MLRFNHVYDIAFEVVSDKEDASDVTPATLKTALESRIQDVFVDSGEWEEACGLCDTQPFDDGSTKSSPLDLSDADYTLVDGSAWFSLGGFSIRIHTTDEGVISDIFADGKEDQEALASTYAFFQDLPKNQEEI